MVSEVSENNDVLAKLLSKPKSKHSFTLYLGDGDDSFEVPMTVQALSMAEYDKVLGKYPPTEKEAARGLTYELDKFAPALIAACVIEPAMNLAEAKKLWSSDNWSRGDIEGIFNQVLRINHRESTIPFSARG